MDEEDTAAEEVLESTRNANTTSKHSTGLPGVYVPTGWHNKFLRYTGRADYRASGYSQFSAYSYTMEKMMFRSKPDGTNKCQVWYFEITSRMHCLYFDLNFYLKWYENKLIYWNKNSTINLVRLILWRTIIWAKLKCVFATPGVFVLPPMLRSSRSSIPFPYHISLNYIGIPTYDRLHWLSDWVHTDTADDNVEEQRNGVGKPCPSLNLWICISNGLSQEKSIFI